MRKFALFLLLTLNFIFTVVLCATENSITVKVTGQGLTKNEALSNAFQEAVRKVVGTYVIFQNKLKDEQLEELIYLNSDAIITDYEELNTELKDGIIRVEINATVVKNEFAKYIKKSPKSNVSDTEILNALNRNRARKIAIESLDYIFKDYISSICIIKKVGDIRFDNISEDRFNIKIDYQVDFNRKAYYEFYKRLTALLNWFCIANSYSQGEDNHWRTSREIEDNFIRKYQKNKKESGVILFCHKLKNGQYGYKCYLVPIDIFNKIKTLLRRPWAWYDTPEVIVRLEVNTHQFYLFKKTIRGYSFPGFHNEHIAFHNWLNYSGNRIDKSATFTFTLDVNEEILTKFKYFKFSIIEGLQAAYIIAKMDKDSDLMLSCARFNYLPAMLARAEQFGEESWHHDAALLGSRHAQQKVNWQNGGLGFEVMGTNKGFMVWSARRGTGIKKGMILKSINGNKVPKYTKELSELIGSFSAGESVSIEFTNGKTITVQTK